MRTLTTLTTLFLICLSAVCGAQTTKLSEQLDSVITADMQSMHVPGFAAIVVKDGKTVFKKGYGLANVQNEQKVDVDKTIFRIGSISKAVTLLALSKLVDDGRLQLNDDVSKFIGGTQNPEGFKDPVCIRHLLTHTTGFDQIGIGRHIHRHDLSLVERKALRPALADFLGNGNLRRVNAAGNYFRYDTYAPTLAGVIIEKITGKTFPMAMKEELFLPLGMQRSAVEVEEQLRSDLALGYGYRGANYFAMPYEVYVTTPASSIDATAADMGRLLEALTSDGANKHGRLFSPEMNKTVNGKQFRPHPDFAGVTHGLFESNQWGSGPEAFAIRSIGHGGDMLGFKSFLIIFPSLKLGIFTTANRNREAGGGNVNVRRRVVDTVLQHYGQKKTAINFEIPNVAQTTDLKEFEGNYCFGTYCHSCTAAEIAQGGWRRPKPFQILAKDGRLQVRNHEFVPIGNDVFVRSDGQQKIFFGRSANNAIQFFVYNDEPYSFERIE